MSSRLQHESSESVKSVQQTKTETTYDVYVWKDFFNETTALPIKNNSYR